MGTKQVACGDASDPASMVEILTKGTACGDRSEVAIAYADGTTNSAAVGDNPDELVHCVAEDASKIAAYGDRRVLETMLWFDALTKSIGVGVGVVRWVFNIKVVCVDGCGNSICLDVRKRFRETGRRDPYVLPGDDEDSPQEDIPKEEN